MNPALSRNCDAPSTSERDEPGRLRSGREPRSRGRVPRRRSPPAPVGEAPTSTDRRTDETHLQHRSPPLWRRSPLAGAGCGSSTDTPGPAGPTEPAALPGDGRLRSRWTSGPSASSRSRRPRPRCSSPSTPARRWSRSTTTRTSRPTPRRPTCPAYKPNVEAIAKHQPDLVVLSNDTEEIVGQLTALSIPAFLAPAATTLDDTLPADPRPRQAHRPRRPRPTRWPQQMRDDIAKLVADLPKRGQPLTYYYELDPTLLLGHLEDVHRLAVHQRRPDQHRRRRPPAATTTRSCRPR